MYTKNLTPDQWNSTMHSADQLGANYAGEIVVVSTDSRIEGITHAREGEGGWEFTIRGETVSENELESVVVVYSLEGFRAVRYTKSLTPDQWSSTTHAPYQFGSIHEEEDVVIVGRDYRIPSITFASDSSNGWSFCLDGGNDYIREGEFLDDIEVYSSEEWMKEQSVIQSGGGLPNGVVVYNTTPHRITFWQDEWEHPIEVEVGELLNARPQEITVGFDEMIEVEYVSTEFAGSDDGRALIGRIKAKHPHAIIVGSIIAAQAYPGDVVSMVPHPDYARVAPDKKRMLPHKFNKF